MGILIANGTWCDQETIAPLSGDYDRHWQASGKTANGIAYRPLARREDDLRGRTPMRPKSLGDLRVSKKMAMGINYPAVPSSTHARLPDRKLSDQQLASDAKQFVSGSVLGHKAGQYSVSSVSSSSSFSSGESIGTPATPMFPSGPSTTAEVMEALRYTHDHFLSTIAAFIGHAHSHSRTSHASSTGHMYDLVREVVDMVCKLLTIVEAVLKHPNLPPQKTESLKAAKEGLYNVTSTLADSVRMLTMAPLPDVSEDEEKSTLLRSATNALKAGSDCVNAVKKSLQRTTGARPIIIQLPIIGDSEASIHTPRTFSHSKTHSGRSVGRSLSLRVLRSHTNDVVDEEDLTIQAQSVSSNDPTVTRRPEDGKGLPRPSLVVSEPEAVDDMPMKSPKNKPLPLPRTSHENAQSEVASLLSTAPTDDDRTTWEGSQRHNRAPSSFEQKLLNGDLPAPPLTEFGKSSEIPWTFPHDYAPEDVAYNSDGQLVGATLDALVERMTPHDSLVEPSFAAVFFLTFRLFTTPTELLNAVIARYNILPPPSLVDADLYQWQQRKGLPVRLRVSNFVKSWLESYWRPSTDNVIVPTLLSFTRDALSIMFPVPSQRIIELVNQWAIASETGIGLKVERVRDAGIPLNPPSTPSSEVPRPIMTKTVLSALRKKDFTSLSVTDFDALELGRQLTTMECSLYCAIQPEEVLETGQEGGTYPVNIRAVTSLSTAITGWVAESILDEPDTKERTALVKFFIKVADRCASLHNFSTPRSILAALDSSTISRLHQTWTGLPQKNKLQLESLRKLADHARNYHEYRSRLRNTAPPAVPFLGRRPILDGCNVLSRGQSFVSDVSEGPEKKLLNFNKYHKLARIVQDMQRFQVQYTLKEIPEVHEYLKDAFERSKHKGDLQDLYRRSLMVEPKQPADTPPSSDVRQLFGWASRSQVTTRPRRDNITPTAATPSIFTTCFAILDSQYLALYAPWL
ncbi:Cell division control protein 25 [Grifola frondosa]|uniref:Cell division control protein 25 n=1 Tax=Grifola frondosa TaxID=5627 RepID=A0A1C7M2G9_GRIFR|nr:Cell division control protein 25 [Grifola frondosa]